MRVPFLQTLAVLVILITLGMSCGGDAPATPTSTASTVDSVATPVSVEPAESAEVDTFTYRDGYIDVSWKKLARMDFEERFNDSFNMMIAYPIFHPQVQALNGKPIRIDGYVIPFEETGNASIVILSAFPFSSCFFCGGAGPESVMDVQLKKAGRRFTRDDKITFQGKLRLNETDLDYLNYILDEAEILE